MERKNIQVAIHEISRTQRDPVLRGVIVSVNEKQTMQRFSLDSYAYSLARIRGDVFRTLTFRSVPSPNKAYGRAWALMRLGAELVERR